MEIQEPPMNRGRAKTKTDDLEEQVVLQYSHPEFLELH